MQHSEYGVRPPSRGGKLTPHPSVTAIVSRANNSNHSNNNNESNSNSNNDDNDNDNNSGGASAPASIRGGSRTLCPHGRTLHPSASGRVAQAARRHRRPSADTHGRCVIAGGQCVRRRRVALLGWRVGASARRSRGVGAGLHGFVRVLARTTLMLTIILIIILIITLIITPMIILIMIPTGWMPPIGSLILEIQGGTH